MPKYLIERTVPSAGELGPEDLQKLSAKSNDVRQGMTGDIQWVQSYVAEDRLFCVYNAESADLIREHATRGGFPCDNIRQVSASIDPVTGEELPTGPAGSDGRPAVRARPACAGDGPDRVVRPCGNVPSGMRKSCGRGGRVA